MTAPQRIGGYRKADSADAGGRGPNDLPCGAAELDDRPPPRPGNRLEPVVRVDRDRVTDNLEGTVIDVSERLRIEAVKAEQQHSAAGRWTALGLPRAGDQGQDHHRGEEAGSPRGS